MDVGGCFQNVDVNFEDLEFSECLSGMRYRLNYRIAGDRRNICISAVSGPGTDRRSVYVNSSVFTELCCVSPDFR